MPKCPTCGKVLKNAFAVKIHAGRMHKKRMPGRLPAAPLGLDVRSLAIDELIALKRQVDGRLADVARRLRLANVAI